MKVYRLSKSKYALDLSGKGAELAGGRWNSRGKPLLYTSQSRALCTAEIAVHTPLGNLPLDYELIEINVPDEVEVLEIKSSDLKPNWKSIPHLHTTQEIGDQFVLEKEFMILKVPSAVIQGDFNYLINPQHPNFFKIEISTVEAFEFDSRLFMK